MRLYWKRDSSMLTLLACLATLPGCSDVSPLAPSEPPVAAFEVTADSSTLLFGHVAQVFGSATDDEGKPVVALVSWESVTPDIATVSTEGVVTALAFGEAIIEGSVGQLTARGKIKVVKPDSTPTPAPEPTPDPAQPPSDAEAFPADLASNNFDAGTLAPYTNPWGVDLDFPNDPTNLGHGRVARFHYQAEIGDQNRAMEFTHARRWGEPMYFRGEFNIAVDDLAANEVLRKLVYWQSHNDYAKYTTNGGLASGRTVVHLTGSDLVVDATFNPAAGSGRDANDVRTVEIVASGLKGHQWYTLEVFQQLESAIGRNDGILRVWLDGNLVFEKTTMTWSDPAWVGSTINTVPFEAADIYFEHFLVGNQVNRNDGGFNEYRYWDNVEFSTRRIRK